METALDEESFQKRIVALNESGIDKFLEVYFMDSVPKNNFNQDADYISGLRDELKIKVCYLAESNLNILLEALVVIVNNLYSFSEEELSDIGSWKAISRILSFETSAASARIFIQARTKVEEILNGLF